MSELIKHECGIALVRLLKPLEFYQEKYGNVLYGFNKLFLLMEKQHNRGQDGAGIGAVKLDVEAGKAYMFRERDNGRNPIDTVIKKQIKQYQKLLKQGVIFDEFPQTVKDHWDFGAEVLLGHLRYGTSGGYSKSVCQPYYRRSPWPTRNLMLAGNFNMTNLERLNDMLINRGAHPIFDTDTQTVLEEIGYHLDEEHTRIYHELRDNTDVPSSEMVNIISERLNPIDILSKAAVNWDGGYALAGMIGNGDSFVMRDPSGIRPGYYFHNDEVAAVASERVALMSIFDQPQEAIQEIKPGHAVVIKYDGRIYEKQFTEPLPRKSCSFERIYFSRGNDPDIYKERKALGGALLEQILESIEQDINHSVFSYIPNTAETAYYGLMDAVRTQGRKQLKETILAAQAEGKKLDESTLDELIMDSWGRGERIAHKDIKLRTFISQEKNRVQLASHVYDISYGVVQPDDYLVCIDDSIVRGTTLKQSILRILARTNPKKIVIASTAPQIRYPDCYGIDMSEMGKFIAFQAAVALLKESGQESLLAEVYEQCVRQVGQPNELMQNYVKRIYDGFTAEQISKKISELVSPPDVEWKGEVEIIYQTIENLHRSCPEHTGDWYFTGNYPTPGGLSTLNRAYIYYYENKSGRSY